MKGLLALCCLCLLAPLARAQPLRDPTRPPQAGHAARRDPVPVLSAVLISGARRGAIVDGEFVRSGSQVGPFLIEAVLDDGVRYRYAGQVRELHLPRALSMIKKPSAAAAPAASGVQP